MVGGETGEVAGAQLCSLVAMGRNFLFSLKAMEGPLEGCEQRTSKKTPLLREVVGRPLWLSERETMWVRPEGGHKVDGWERQ